MSENHCKPLQLPLTQAEERRFNKYVRKGPPDECWPWMGARSERGYGVFQLQGSAVRANRIAYFLHHGEDPYPSLTRHSCDNPWCVNGTHLLKGSHTNNMQDMVERKRAATGDENGSRLYPERLKRGEQHGMAKITAATVILIRADSDAGKTDAAIAATYGISPSLVAQIVTGKIWTHLLNKTLGIEEPRQRKGSGHYRAKLTDEIVREIRRKKAEGRTYQSLANEYGMSLYATYALCTGKSWKHVI